MGFAVHHVINPTDEARIFYTIPRAMNAIHDLGVLHCDGMARNILWHEEPGRTFIIHIERSKPQQRRNDGGKSLGIISPNKESLRALPAADTKTDVMLMIVEVREEDFAQEVRRAVNFTADLLCS